MPDNLLKSSSFIAINKQLNELFELSYNRQKKDRGTLSWRMLAFVDDMSEALVDHSRHLYSQIEVSDFARDINKEGGDNLKRMISYGTNLDNLVAVSIVQETNPSKRVFNYEVWIQIMNHCYLKGDLFSALSIYTGLTKYYVEQYINGSLSKESTSILKALAINFNKMISGGRSLQIQKDLDSSRKIPIIPVPQGLIVSITNGFELYNHIMDEYSNIKDSTGYKKILEQEIKKKETEIVRIIHLLENKVRELPFEGKDQTQYEYMKRILAELRNECRILKEQYRAELAAQYDELFEVAGGYIPESIQDCSGVKPIFDFLEENLKVNKRMCKREPFAHDIIVELMDEVGDLLKGDPDFVEKFATVHYEETRTKKISKDLAKVFATLERPEVVLCEPTKTWKFPVREPKEKLDGMDRCTILLRILENLIDEFKPEQRPQLRRRNGHMFFRIETENVDELTGPPMISVLAR